MPIGWSLHDKTLKEVNENFCFMFLRNFLFIYKRDKDVLNKEYVNFFFNTNKTGIIHILTASKEMSLLVIK